SSDAYFLLAIIHTLFTEDLARLGRLAEFTDGVEKFIEFAQDYAPETVADLTGISADEIRRIAIEFANAKTAVCYGRIGVSTQKFGGICQWLINAINILTANFDRKGGAMFTAPAFDVLQVEKSANIYNRWQSRARKLPEFMGELPVATLAEEILTEGEGQIKALITSCGNPVLSTPNGKQLENALEKLDFMVSIDIYVNETTRHANIILPTATGLETSHYDVIFYLLAVRNAAKYSAPLFPKAENAKYDWEVFQTLAHRLKRDEGKGMKDESESEKDLFISHPSSLIPQLTPPEAKLNFGLMFGRYKLSLEELQKHPHGIDLGELKPCLPERLLTENKRINLAPEIIVKDLEKLKAQMNQTNDFPFALIGRRHLRDNNSWLHNSEILMKGKNRCTALINDADAAKLNLENGANVKITSRVGAIEIPCEITDTIAEGVISIPPGYGHEREGFSANSLQSGASINDLTDECEIDELTGNAAFNGTNVRLEKI
ncbi:MAG TPA: molybdopterin dinucleotide binding domain-containing protein, partial [Pyrinomonadaceae bacterium]|nr:molybdopterin dinucleotide binding domain-containing protein [Pyrinomonadaceae bacterium]